MQIRVGSACTQLIPQDIIYASNWACQNGSSTCTPLIFP